jgi:transcriptional regulator with XRE-family HTH domain
MTSTELKIGQKIKALRLAEDLTQEELAIRAKLTKGFISQLENEQSSISVDSLSDLLDALGITLRDFFSDSDTPQVVFAPDERVEVDGLGSGLYQLLVPHSTTLTMDPVILELEPTEGLDEVSPYSGEQFGYVLRGAIVLRIGNKKYQVRKNHCFYFRCDKPHQITNEGSSPATLLLVTTPPQM